MSPQKKSQLGKLTPRYRFILNPYEDVRFTRCPQCEQKTKQRKLPLFIHVHPFNPVVLGKTCRYCPDCDLLIAHQDEIEANLAMLFTRINPDIVGNEYLIMGTVERKAWRQSLKNAMAPNEMLDHLHDFEDVLRIEVRSAGWYRTGDT